MSEHTFRVRWYQERFHKALVERAHDRLMAVWHRRAGKDEIVLNGFRDIALQRPGNYWHCFPEYKQARKAIWNGVNANTGKRRIDEAFPPFIRRRVLDDDMFIEFNNGATWQLLGSDRYDATVGAGAAGIAYSEWALCNPSAWAYHSPMIRENNGFAAFITTPRGNNHAKTMYDRAMTSPDWFCELLTIEDTEALSPEVLAEAMLEYQDLHGMDVGRAMFEQEYLCSWSGAMVGAYFGAEMNRAEQDGRIRPVPIDWGHPINTTWDLGKAINNPIWIWQRIAGQLRVVDFYEPESEDLDDWIAWLNDRGYHGFDYVPHDILVTEWGTGTTRLARLQSKRGESRVKRISRVSVADGLQAGRTAINEAVFHAGDDDRAQRVAKGIEGNKNYRREWDDDRKTFRETPYKDWSEHIGSAWRYVGLAQRDYKPPEPKRKVPKELVYEVGSDGRIKSNMSVRDIVDRKVRKRKLDD